jgi:hypothetical protein
MAQLFGGLAICQSHLDIREEFGIAVEADLPGDGEVAVGALLLHRCSAAAVDVAKGLETHLIVYRAVRKISRVLAISS